MRGAAAAAGRHASSVAAAALGERLAAAARANLAAGTGRQPNLSYFAFTATPKARTLELFGERVADGHAVPFHLYSMRQAIEERFILDVLRNYVTYKTFYRLAKTLEDDPKVPTRTAATAIARYVSLHPSNVAQRVQVIVDHFRTAIGPQLGGRAKAMVVTRSRLHAVRFRQAIDRYLESEGIEGVHALVAFSGTVSDEHGLDYTEAGMNGFGEKELPDRFASDAYQLLVVAEKYQTGFDQPLLCAMYVDKKLDGVNAVQTLSRLNRIYPGKEEPFVLFFANDAEAIQEAFEPFYEVALAEPTDANVLFDAEATLREHDVIRDADVAAFVEVFLKPAHEQRPGDQAALYAATDPAVERYLELAPEEREAFRRSLKRFLRLYAFLAQIVPVLGPELERLYLYGRLLANQLPREREPGLDIDPYVDLTHLRLQKMGEQQLELAGEAEALRAVTGTGTGPEQPAQTGFLSEVVQALNERFGTDFTRADALFIEQVVEEAVADQDLAQQAAANTVENFRFGFNRAFEGLVLDRHSANAELIERLEDPKLYDAIREIAMREVYARLSAGR